MLKHKNHDVWVSCMRLGRYMGCHQRSDRSFFYKNRQFPVCARCTGVFVGQVAALTLFILKIRLHIWVCISFCAIMFGDWLIQRLNLLESTNTRRLLTGVLGGYGYITIFMELLLFLIRFFIR
ncbi:MAG: DUF2085 domain-containing protein [Clostridia bacterium]|nr:DUF2085 domain-containing protein [Clostridia bacterium]